MRGLKAKTGSQFTAAELRKFQAEAPGMDIKPGTTEFGLRAAARKERLRRGGRTDLRLKTAAKTVKGARDEKNRYLMGD